MEETELEKQMCCRCGERYENDDEVDFNICDECINDSGEGVFDLL